MDLNNPLEQLPEDLKSWKPEDVAWLATVPEMLQGVARRHGRELFSIAMQSGGVMHAFGILNSQTRGNRACAQACAVIGKSYDDLVKALLGKMGVKVEDLLACRRDIELVASLVDGGKQRQAGERMSKGGIILDS